jgi:hypothetical protein
MLVCPSCGHTFPCVAVNSRGWCKCGMDFDYDPTRGTVQWTPDPKYTSSDAQAVETPIREETWPE